MSWRGSEYLAAQLKQPVVVENRPGIGGTIGLQFVASAAPDGLTLGIGTTGAMVATPHLGQGPSTFDPLSRLTPIAKLVEVPLVLVALPQTGFTSLADVLARVRADPSGLPYGTSGVNSSPHFAMDMLARRMRVNLIHVPYRAAPSAVTDVISGHLSMACVDLTTCFDHIQAGTLRAIGTTGSRRSGLLPEVPTFREQTGEDIEVTAWSGLCAPAGLSAEITDTLARHAAAALTDKTVLARIERMGLTAEFLPPSEFKSELARESLRMKAVIEAMRS